MSQRSASGSALRDQHDDPIGLGAGAVFVSNAVSHDNCDRVLVEYRPQHVGRFARPIDVALSDGPRRSSRNPYPDPILLSDRTSYEIRYIDPLFLISGDFPALAESETASKNLLTCLSGACECKTVRQLLRPTF